MTQVGTTFDRVHELDASVDVLPGLDDAKRNATTHQLQVKRPCLVGP